ncbi:eamA-like transporter family protein [Synechococcus sp. PROS-7-1]|uniref:DMT family transporter n=1 Tax=Synechococcus sp. PROS-7-1 TaxID=1442556 RepID=UPI001644313A|nr:DMT family transporter [Synechococcus sp. PROS-7-1]QNI86528.1 eamA-like transporter family protein [Synechococcus sp. PROS-7-1]
MKGLISPQLEVLVSRSMASMRPVVISLFVINAMTLGPGVAHVLVPWNPWNALLAGNLCAALLLLVWHKPGLMLQQARQTSWRSWLLILVDAALASSLSALIFVGLESTTASNAILIGRLAPVLYALLGAVFFRTRVLTQEWFGYGFIIVGVMGIVLIGNHEMIRRGDLLILISTIVFALSSIIGKAAVKDAVEVELLLFARNVVSSLLFFVVAGSLLGFQQFEPLSQGIFWLIMLLYAALLIVVSQYLWYQSSRSLSTISMGRWAAPGPLIGLMAAFLINGDRPTTSQLLGAAVIILGVTVTTFKPTHSESSSHDEALEKKVTLADSHHPIGGSACP